jgi:ABC-type transporter Mla maintaining outer membrane lipid asymmetry ATPase subunit MlaF
MSDEPIVLSATDISQRLGGNLILDKLSFKVRDRVRPGVITGQVVGLLGPSGVGKTRLAPAHRRARRARHRPDPRAG